MGHGEDHRTFTIRTGMKVDMDAPILGIIPAIRTNAPAVFTQFRLKNIDLDTKNICDFSNGFKGSALSFGQAVAIAIEVYLASFLAGSFLFVCSGFLVYLGLSCPVLLSQAVGHIPLLFAAGSRQSILAVHSLSAVAVVAVGIGLDNAVNIHIGADIAQLQQMLGKFGGRFPIDDAFRLLQRSSLEIK